MTGGTGVVKVPWSVLSDYQCFGCSPHNAAGLGLVFEADPIGLRTRFVLGRAFESYPGVVHGGLVGVVCDETMGNLIVLDRGVSAFTTSMRTRYLQPLLVGRPYTCVAALRPEAAGDLIHATADIEDEAGVLVAGASAVYQPFAVEHVRDRLALSDDDASAVRGALDAHRDRRT